MKGNLAAVPNLALRCQEFIAQLSAGQNPNSFHADCVSKLSDVVVIPDELISKIEEFDPSILLVDTVEQHLPRILQAITDFRGDDKQFASEMEQLITNLVSVLVIDLEEGFGNFEDAKTFVKANITEMLTVASEPKNAKLTVMLGVNPILNFFVKCRGVQPEPAAPLEEKKENIVVAQV